MRMAPLPSVITIAKCFAGTIRRRVSPDPVSSMRSNSSGKSRRRRAAGWLGHDGRRALVACLCLMGLLGLVMLAGAGSPSAMRWASAQGYDGDELATGSILFFPVFGNRCRQRLIDNATWRISDAGEVDCKAALSEPASARAPQWSASRVDVIRDGFRKK